MAVELDGKSLPSKLVQIFHRDLTIKGKSAKGGAYKARIAELCTFQVGDQGDGRYIIPLHYARLKLDLSGLRIPKQVDFKVIPAEFRSDKFCQQRPVFDEAMEHLRKESSCFLQLHCGWGKTWMAIMIAAHLGLRTVVLVHRTFLAQQFLNEAENIIPGQMRFLDDNKQASLSEYLDAPIVVIMRQRAFKLPESFTSTFDFMIVDEAKYWCTPEGVKSMLCFKPTHTMGLCAERERKDGYDVVLGQFFGHNIFRKSCKPFRVWKYFTSFQPEIKRPTYGKAKMDWTVAMRSISRMDDRNAMIRDICRLRSTSKIMILVQFQEHVEELLRLLKEVGENVDTFYAGADSYVNCRILIATFSKAEMGFDDKNLCENFDGHRLDLLILGAFYKGEIEQSAGRVMRSDAPEVIDLVDDHGSLRKHSGVRDKFFKSRNGQIMPPEFLFPLKRQ